MRCRWGDESGSSGDCRADGEKWEQVCGRPQQSGGEERRESPRTSGGQLEDGKVKGKDMSLYHIHCTFMA